MSFLGVLVVDEKTFNIINLELPFEYGGNKADLVVGDAQGPIKVCIDSFSNGSEIFWDWVQDYNCRKDGELTIVLNEEDGEMKVITFKSARCVRYEENFDSAKKIPLVMKLTISPESLNSSGTNFDKTLKDLLN